MWNVECHCAHYAVQQVASQEFELTITDICGNGFQIFWGGLGCCGIFGLSLLAYYASTGGTRNQPNNG